METLPSKVGGWFSAVAPLAAPPTVSDSMKPRPISPVELMSIAGSTE